MCSVGYNQIRSISEEKHVDCFKNALRRTSKSARWCCFFCFLTLTPGKPCYATCRTLYLSEPTTVEKRRKTTMCGDSTLPRRMGIVISFYPSLNHKKRHRGVEGPPVESGFCFVDTQRQCN